MERNERNRNTNESLRTKSVLYPTTKKIAFAIGEREREYWKECHYFVIEIIQSFMSLKLYRILEPKRWNHIIRKALSSKNDGTKFQMST